MQPVVYGKPFSSRWLEIGRLKTPTEKISSIHIKVVAGAIIAIAIVGVAFIGYIGQMNSPM